MPKCPECGSIDMIESWNEDDFKGYKGKTELVCEHCHAQFDVLIKMVPRTKGRKVTK